MKWKIKFKEKKEKETMFLFFPRYCGDCGNVYWLERVKSKGFDYPSVFCECGRNMYYTKSFAVDDLRDKKSK